MVDSVAEVLVRDRALLGHAAVTVDGARVVHITEAFKLRDCERDISFKLHQCGVFPSSFPSA